MMIAVAMGERARVRTRVHAPCALHPPFSHVPNRSRSYDNPPYSCFSKPDKLWRGVWGLARRVFFYCLLSLLSFSRLGNTTLAFPCGINTGGSRGGDHSFLRVERVLVSVLVWRSGLFRISLSRIPRYTWPHSISATQSIALAVPVWQAGIYWVGIGDPWDGTAAGREGALLFLVGWEGKDCA